MAQVLAVQTQSESHRMPGSGLRRNKSSQSLLSNAASSSAPRRSRRETATTEHQSPVRTKRPAKVIPTSYDHARDGNPSQTSSILRRTESETTLHAPHKRRPRPSLRTPNITLLERSQAPPSSPLNISPPTGSSPSSAPLVSTHVIYLKSEDDTSIKPEVSRHVDYLTYEWQEEELWNSWRHIVSNRNVYGERSRLENASWRTWWKQKNSLNTLAPEKLNWHKDNDVTWLYGPLQTPNHFSISEQQSESHSRLSKSNSFCGTKKPILKKRSMSEVMLQKSLSSSSLVRQAAAAVQAQQVRRGSVARRTSDFTPYSDFSPHKEALDYFSSSSTSGLQTPSEQGERKHIQFADKVTQCIAVEIKGAEEDEEENRRSAAVLYEDGIPDDEGLLMMRSIRRHSHSKVPIRRRGSTGENKMIEMLPATRLKDRPETPEVPEGMSHSLLSNQPWRPSHLSPSPSMETLRPHDPSRNFLIGEDGADFLDSYNAEDDNLKDGQTVDEEAMLRHAHEKAARERGLRRTASGMLMPEDELENQAFGGVVGSLLDTVNTAKDIAHVIWNVGWRR